MAQTDFGISIIAGTGGIMNQDIWGTIDEQLHEQSPEIGAVLEELVRAKTPILTGSLQESMSYDAYLDTGDADLVWVYADDLEQIQEWNRIYVQYQEGGPLGEETYTNDPHQMFLNTAETDGLVWTEIWARQTINDALDLCIAGAGLPI